MQYGPSAGGTVNYEPNTLAGGMPSEAPLTGTPAVYHVEDNIVRQKITLTGDYTQAGERYRSLGKLDQDHLVDNIVDSLGQANKPIQQRMVDHFAQADSELGKRVAMGLGL
jgi:catalase